MFSSFGISLFGSSFAAGMALSLSLIVAIGPQNAHLLRLGLARQHLWLSVITCAIADIVMITIGIAGLAKLGQLPDRVYGAMLGAAIVMLVVYGAQAAQRFWHAVMTTKAPAVANASDAMNRNATDSDAMNSNAASHPTVLSKPALSRRQALMQALAFSWLNPHAWIDTAVLIGGASLAYQAKERTEFGIGAMTGSVVWFIAIGTLAFWLGRRLSHTNVWRWVDGLVALMMWTIAAGLAVSLFG